VFLKKKSVLHEWLKQKTMFKTSLENHGLKNRHHLQVRHKQNRGLKMAKKPWSIHMF